MSEKERLKELVLQYKIDNNSDTLLLILDHLEKLITSTVKRAMTRWRGKLLWNDFRDLYHAAILGITHSITLLDASVPAEKYVSRMVGHMRVEIRKAMTREYRWSKAKADGKVAVLPTYISMEEEMNDEIESDDIKGLLFDMVKDDILSLDEYNLLVWIYFDHIPKPEVAKRFGIKRHTLYYRERRLLCRLGHQFRIRGMDKE